MKKGKEKIRIIPSLTGLIAAVDVKHHERKKEESGSSLSLVSLIVSVEVERHERKKDQDHSRP